MANINIDPLLDMYLENPKVKSLKQKKEIRDALVESIEYEKNKKVSKVQAMKNTNLKKEIQSNTQSYHKLVDNLNLQKVLVGSFNEMPYYAMVDFNNRICIPCFKDKGE